MAFAMGWLCGVAVAVIVICLIDLLRDEDEEIR